MPRRKPSFTFADLFAGIGGFHAAAHAAGGEAVYASEIDKDAAAVYHGNWGLNPLGDIKDDANDDGVNVPDHDVLFAGFPCQPFSKSGAQRGMDEARGTLFWNIARIIEERRPRVVILENVRNLIGPKHLHEWQIIIETLRGFGYRVSDEAALFSPHLLPPDRGGRPQTRDRVFITATWTGDYGDPTDLLAEPVANGKEVDGWKKKHWHLETDLPLDPDHHADGCDLGDDERLWIDAWADFVTLMNAERTRRLPGFPFWADSWVHEKKLVIPDGTPKWKVGHLTKNAAFYTAHKRTLDRWTKKWGVYTDAFPESRRKFEWQAQETPNLWDTVMQFRPSGLRAKAPTYVPALVAITQTTIVGPRERRLSPREAARMQGLPDWFDFGDQTAATTYKQLGNGVNVGVVWHILKEHVARDEDLLKRTAPGLLKAIQDAPDSPDDILANRTI
jgi:DNA (cytosine-5)-methyltransferase 1